MLLLYEHNQYLYKQNTSINKYQWHHPVTNSSLPPKQICYDIWQASNENFIDDGPFPFHGDEMKGKKH